MKTRPPSKFQEYLEIHASTQGWFEPAAAATWDCLLTEQAKSRSPGHLLEIGVWHGKSAALLVMHTKADQEQCYLVDVSFKNSPIKQTLRRIRRAGLNRLVRLVEMSSRDFAHSRTAIRRRNQFRFGHIDGEHTGTAVYEDLQLCNDLICSDGLVSVDDFMCPMYPQITDAVFRYIRDYPDRFTIFLCGYNKAYLARPKAVHYYLKFTATTLLDHLEERGFELALSKTTAPEDMNCFGIGPRRNSRKYRGPDWDLNSIRY